MTATRSTEDHPLAPLPAYQCYDCRMCGECCRGIFTIGVRPEERERILAQGWETEPDLQGVPLFVKHHGKWRVANRPDGCCVFQGADGLCRIHAKFGEPAKPLACRLYPFKLIPAGETVRTDLRFDCPAVAGSEGKPVSAYRDDVLALMPRVFHDGVPERPCPPLHDDSPLSWPYAEIVTSAFLRLLRHRDFDLTKRVAACVELVHELRALRVDKLEAPALGGLLDAFEKRVAAEVAADPLERQMPPAMARLALRQLLCVYGREDRWGEARGGMRRRLNAYLRMLSGRGLTPPLRPGFPAVPFRALDEPLGIPPDEIMEPLARYLRVRLESLGFFGMAFYGFDFLDGLSALLLTYPMTLWFARVEAAGRGLIFPDAACMVRGVQLVNHVHGVSPVFRNPLERLRFRFLCRRSVLRRLVAWYGR